MPMITVPPFEEAYDRAERERASEIEVQTMITWAQHDAAAAPDAPRDLCPDCGFSGALIRSLPAGDVYWCANCTTEYFVPRDPDDWHEDWDADEVEFYDAPVEYHDLEF